MVVPMLMLVVATTPPKPGANMIPHGDLQIFRESFELAEGSLGFHAVCAFTIT